MINSREFKDWMRRNDPDSGSVTYLELTVDSAYEREVESSHNAERFYQAEANAERIRREMIERHCDWFVARYKFWQKVALCLAFGVSVCLIALWVLAR